MPKLDQAGNVVRDNAGNIVYERFIPPGLGALGYTLKTNLVPTLAGELAEYGIVRLGEELGLDPRISQIAGITVSSGVSSFTRTGDLGQKTLTAISNGLAQGALQVGLSFATQDLNPLLGGLASSVVGGAIEGMISPKDPNNPLDPERKGIFAGIADSLTNAIGGFREIGLIDPANPLATAQGLAKLNDFSNIVREQGFGAAVETYATSLLYRSSVESLVTAGNSFSIRQEINRQLQDPNNLVDLEGREAIQISLGVGPNGQRQYLWVDPTTHVPVASLQGQDYIRYGRILVDPKTGTAGMPDGTRETTYLSGDEILARVVTEIQGADVKGVAFEDAQGNKWTISPDSLGHLRLNDDGTIKHGILTEYRTGAKLFFQDGELINTLEPVNPLELSAEQKTHLAERYGLTTEELDAFIAELADEARISEGQYDWGRVYPHLDQNIAWDLFHPAAVLIGTLRQQAIAEADAEAAQQPQQQPSPQPSPLQKAASWFKKAGQKMQGAVDWYKANVLGGTDPKIQEQLKQRIRAVQPEFFDGDERPSDISLVAGRGNTPLLRSPQFGANQIQWRLDSNNEVVVIDLGEKAVAMGVAFFRGFVDSANEPNQTPESVADLMAWRYRDTAAADKVNALVAAFGGLNAAARTLQSGAGVYHIRLDRFGKGWVEDTDRYRWSVYTEMLTVDPIRQIFVVDKRPIKDREWAESILNKWLNNE